MDPQFPHMETSQHRAEASDVITVRMGRDDQVDVDGPVAPSNVIDNLLPSVLEAGVDDHNGRRLSPWQGVAQRDRVAALALLSNGQEVDLIHVRLASGDVSPIETSCSWIAT